MNKNQRERRNACRRARYANLTREQRDKQTVLQRVRRAARTGEQHARKRAYERDRYANLPEEQREKWIANNRNRYYKRKYGITLQQYENMLAAQNGRCAICGRPPSGRMRLAVDHDHETGEVRGLLCFVHNRGLGMFDDDPALLYAAGDYIKKSRV